MCRDSRTFLSISRLGGSHHAIPLLLLSAQDCRGPMWPPGLQAPQEREGSPPSECGKSLVWTSTLSSKSPLKPPEKARSGETGLTVFTKGRAAFPKGPDRHT